MPLGPSSPVSSGQMKISFSHFVTLIIDLFLLIYTHSGMNYPPLYKITSVAVERSPSPSPSTPDVTHDSRFLSLFHPSPTLRLPLPPPDPLSPLLDPLLDPLDPTRHGKLQRSDRQGQSPKPQPPPRAPSRLHPRGEGTAVPQDQRGD